MLQEAEERIAGIGERCWDLVLKRNTQSKRKESSAFGHRYRQVDREVAVHKSCHLIASVFVLFFSEIQPKIIN